MENQLAYEGTSLQAQRAVMISSCMRFRKLLMICLRVKKKLDDKDAWYSPIAKAFLVLLLSCFGFLFSTSEDWSVRDVLIQLWVFLILLIKTLYWY